MIKNIIEKNELFREEIKDNWTADLEFGLFQGLWYLRILFIKAKLNDKNIRFPMKGKYSFSVEQAMRTPALPMIMEIGMRIEKFEKEWFGILAGKLDLFKNPPNQT